MSWSSIYGHDQQKQFFQRIIKNQSQSHAYLFTGPARIGKKTLAFEIARVFNCTDPNEDGSCGLCRNCQLIIAGTHPDVQLLSPRDGKIIIKEIRDFIFRLGLQRTLGKYRIGIIESAELFSKEEIQNCLLKSIEEPPEKSVIILVTSQVHALLPTILSRCQRIHFQPLKKEDIKQYLQKNYEISDQKAQDIADQSHGSIGNALDLMDGNQPLVERAFFLWDWIFEGKEIFSLGPWFTENKEQIMNILSQLEWYLRDVLIYQMNGSKSSQYLTFINHIDRIQLDSTRLSSETICRLFRYMEQLEKDLRNNLNLDIAALHFVLQIREEMDRVPSGRN